MAANLQSMCQYWKNFDLPEIQKQLDVTATDLASKQDDSEGARKKLVEQSREFKKNTPDEIRKSVAPLLKSFQGEIDSLTKRSKNAEAGFLSIYKKLIDVPDPVGVLEHSLQLQKRATKAQDLEIENKQLRETLDEYNHEFAEIKNQEVTIKSLREKVREYEEQLEVSAEALARDKERILQRQFADKERQLQETQLSVAKKLGEAEHRVSTLQSALDSTQSELFDLRAKYDEATAAKSDMMEMVMADLERANERAGSAEREREQLAQQLVSATQNLQQAERMQNAPDMEQAIDILKRSSLEVELAAKEKEISQLVEDVQRLQSTVNKLRDTASSQVARLEEELSTRNRAFVILEEKLKQQQDYDEIKRELRVLKSSEFGEEEAAVSPIADKAKSLETLLLEKNRALQNENTQLKVATNDLTSPVSRGSSAPTPSTPTAVVTTPPVVSTPTDAATPSATPPKPHPITSTDAFATMLGQEIVASYHFQNHLHLQALENGHGHHLPNGFMPMLPFPHPIPPPHFTPVSLPTPPIPTPLPSPSISKLPNGHSHPDSPKSGSEGPVSLQRLPVLANPGSTVNSAPPTAASDAANAQNLDTADVAQKIREILSSHNIGQRLFAKHVLGLSQGTVSELLSKPKHWDKLTEKGRESYRKMNTWACDEGNVLALKALSPKKGNQPVLSSYKQEDSATEERINQILNQAQVAMQHRHVQEKSQVANAMVASIYQQELAKMTGSDEGRSSHSGKDSSSPRPSDSIPLPPHTPMGHHHGNSGRDSAGLESTRGRKPQTDSGNLTQDMVARIYQEELMKLAQAAEQSGNIAELTMYRQELARLAQNAQQRQEREDSGQENKENEGTVRVKEEPGEESGSGDDHKDYGFPDSPSQMMPQDLSMHAGNNSDGMRHAGSAFFLVRPRSNSANGGNLDDVSPQFTPAPGESMSPLQRMQSIANSLMSKNQGVQQPQRPLKAVLPPITQEQFDQFTAVNTDDLVKKVKDTLSQYSISQRLFGENVLGLSQGSVSDLLARPKPWHMLTQKGREPFIRMHLFLEDQHAIPHLVASQYRIPPDKFLRSAEYTEPCTIELLNQPWVPIPISTATITTSSPTTSPSSSASSSSSSTSSASSTSTSVKPTVSDKPKPPPIDLPVAMPPLVLPPHIAQHNNNNIKPLILPPMALPPPMSSPRQPMPSSSCSTTIPSPIPSMTMASMPSPLSMHTMAPPMMDISPSAMMAGGNMPVLPMQPSIFEIAAMTHELDTVTVTSRVREVLQFHNLGQKLFGEAVLGLSQGSVSELLSKPKPWHMLSLKGREPFIKMHLWLADPFNVERLRMYQSHMKARYNRLQEQYTDAFAALQDQKQLITQLEEDLHSVNALSSMFRPEVEGEAVAPSQSAELVAGAVKDISQSVIEPFPAAPAVMSPVEPMKSAADALLPIVQSQRERFRVRAQELEVQNASQQQQVHVIQNEMDKMRSDNVKLYEKIKFLQGYPSQEKRSMPDDTESRYSHQYEQKLDPFSSFSRKERQRKYMSLKPYDKITLSMGRFIMGNSVARTVVFFYTIILHILVFLVLYKMAYTSSCVRDMSADWHEKFAEHMKQVHGDQEWEPGAAAAAHAHAHAHAALGT